LGVPLPFILGVIAALLNFVPYIGAIGGAVPAVLIALSQGPQQALLLIAGSVAASIDEVKHQFVVGPLSGFDFDILHAPGDYIFTSPYTIQVATNAGITGSLLSGKGHSKKASAQFMALAALAAADPATAVPEPASLALFGTGLLGLGVLRGKRTRRFA
jgi:hypothetical protein